MNMKIKNKDGWQQQFVQNNNYGGEQKRRENFRQLWDQMQDLNEMQDQSRNQQMPILIDDNSVISKHQSSSLNQSHILTRAQKNTSTQTSRQNNKFSTAKQIQSLKEVVNRLLDDNKKLFEECIKLRKLINKYQSNQLLLAHQLQHQNKIKLFQQKEKGYYEKIRVYQQRVREYQDGQRIYQQKQIEYLQKINEYEHKIRQYEQKSKQTHNNSINCTNLPQQKRTIYHPASQSQSTSSLYNPSTIKFSQHQNLQSLLKDKQRQITNIKVIHHAQLKQYKETIKDLQRRIQSMKC